MFYAQRKKIWSLFGEISLFHMNFQWCKETANKITSQKYAVREWKNNIYSAIWQRKVMIRKTLSQQFYIWFKKLESYYSKTISTQLSIFLENSEVYFLRCSWKSTLKNFFQWICRLCNFFLGKFIQCFSAHLF